MHVLMMLRHLFSLGLVAPILEPDLDLGLGKLESRGQIGALRARQVALKVKTLLQLDDLGVREGGARTLLLRLDKQSAVMRMMLMVLVLMLVNVCGVGKGGRGREVMLKVVDRRVKWREEKVVPLRRKIGRWWWQRWAQGRVGEWRVSLQEVMMVVV